VDGDQFPLAAAQGARAAEQHLGQAAHQPRDLGAVTQQPADTRIVRIQGDMRHVIIVAGTRTGQGYGARRFASFGNSVVVAPYPIYPVERHDH
jgi:hypothetical protein